MHVNTSAVTFAIGSATKSPAHCKGLQDTQNCKGIAFYVTAHGTEVQLTRMYWHTCGPSAAERSGQLKPTYCYMLFSSKQYHSVRQASQVSVQHAPYASKQLMQRCHTLYSSSAETAALLHEAHYMYQLQRSRYIWYNPSPEQQLWCSCHVPTPAKTAALSAATHNRATCCQQKLHRSSPQHSKIKHNFK